MFFLSSINDYIDYREKNVTYDDSTKAFSLFYDG